MSLTGTLCTSHRSPGVGRARRAVHACVVIWKAALHWPRSRPLTGTDKPHSLHFRRSTAHTTTSQSEQISLSFRLSPQRSPAAAERQPPADSSTAGGAAAQDATEQASEQTAGQAAPLPAASNATSGGHVTVLS